MRLLVVTQYFWPENFRINDLVAELVRRGHEVTILTGRPNYPQGKVFPQYIENLAAFSRFEGQEVIRVPMVPRGTGGIRLMLNYFTFAVNATVLGLWKLRGRQFDAVFAYEPSPITVGLPAAALRAVKRAPMAFWVLDLWPETLEAIGVVRSPALLRMVGKLVTFIYRRCDLILAQSKSFIPQIRRYAGSDGRIEYFPSWAESLFDASDVASAAEVAEQPDSFNVMFAGNIGDAQDFPAILAAAERLKEHRHIRWLIVGDGRMFGWVTEEIERRSLQDTVVLLGRYPVERMPSFFRHAHALLVSLKDEPIFAMTIPGKLQSYLVAGIPIVAMLNGEGAEIVQSVGAGLTCASGDHEALVARVLELSRMTDAERAQMGRDAQALSMREFDRDTLIGRLENWLKTMSYGKCPPCGSQEAK
ncbi:putative glycosyltransferase [Candidatus Burkholderia pumila]|uniref:Glycosyltransferase n=1 Tax=Candidatus Burkholderia pumila TaxID=1090375 RepID=A0ABR5HLW1_9BURK|nr:putative glycosyltransferase [Candidatus Burkholderia pumila]